MKKNLKSLFMLVMCSALILPTTVSAIGTMTREEYEQKIKDAPEHVYLDSFEEYEEMLQEFDDNAENKVYFLEQLAQEIQYINDYKKIDIYKAEVIEVVEPELRYIQNDDYSYGMGWYQNGIVKITEKNSLLNGYEFSYMTNLTYDPYGNMTSPRIRVGDTVNISLMEINENQYVACSPIMDIYVQRFPTAMILVCMFVIFLLLYFGRKSIKIIVPLILIVDLVIFYMSSAIYQGVNVWFALGFVVILNTIALSVLKLGGNWKTIVSIISTLLVSFAMIMVHYGMDAILNFAGLTIDNIFLTSAVPPMIIGEEVVPQIDMHAFSVAVGILLVSVVSNLAAIKVIESCEKNAAKMKYEEEVKKEVNEYLGETTLIVAMFMIAQLLPACVNLFAEGYKLNHLLQSELFWIEVLRVIIVIIGLILTVPLTIVVYKALEDK